MQTTDRKVPTIRDPWPYNPFVTSIRLYSQDLILRVVDEYEVKYGFRASLFDVTIQVMIVACSYDPGDVWQTETSDVRITSELISKGSMREASEIFVFALQSGNVTLNAHLIETIAKHQVKRLHKIYTSSSYAGKPLAHTKKIKFDMTAKLTKLTYTDIKLQDDIHQAVAIEKYSGQEIIFRPVDQTLSSACAKTFHYLHTPRLDDLFAFGAFLPGETVPFAWVSYGEVDRKYKHSMLQAAGLDHTKSLELTRAWNHEHSPRNTMSMLYAYAHTAIQQHWVTKKNTPLKSIITAVNPNLGFRGSAFRAVGFKVIGEKPTTYHYLVDQFDTRIYATRRDLADHQAKTNGKTKHIEAAFPLVGTKELAVVLDGPKNLQVGNAYQVSGKEYSTI
jgi:hypothetical protein